MNKKIQNKFLKAINLHQNNQLNQAEAIYCEILKNDPENADILHHLGILYGQMGHFEAAIDSIQKAISINPNSAVFYFNLGLTFRNSGNQEKAIQSFMLAHELDSMNYDVCFNIGLEFQIMGRFDLAAFYYERAINVKPDSYEALSNLGAVFQHLGENEKAVETYKKAVLIKPDQAELYNNLAVALQNSKKFDEALDFYRMAIKLQPDFVNSYINMGSLLHEKNDINGAIENYQKAISLDPEYSESYYNLANVLQKQLKLDQAIELYRHVISKNFKHAKAHYNLGLALLLNGDLINGFKEFEWRWATDDFPEEKRIFNRPEWDGSEFKGKTLLIYAEQGIGDTIQFVRYLPFLKNLGGSIIFEVAPELSDLVFGMADKVIHKNEKPPHFDFHISIMSLPFLFKTSLETIPSNVPYIKINQNLEKFSGLKKIIEKQSKKFKIGIVWAGSPLHSNDHNRSCDLSNFAKLFKLDKCAFYSLQKGNRSNELNNYKNFNIENFDKYLIDFSYTAYIIKKLDLLITVDTACAHLAGALGKPVWLLLPFAPDWRWLLKDDKSPWYPSVRLFRQKRKGEWKIVFDNIFKILKKQHD